MQFHVDMSVLWMPLQNAEIVKLLTAKRIVGRVEGPWSVLEAIEVVPELCHVYVKRVSSAFQNSFCVLKMHMCTCPKNGLALQMQYGPRFSSAWHGNAHPSFSVGAV